jgi:hypothetical protein
MVEPDFAECLRNPADLRAAFHVASSLFHMHDWVWQTHKAAVQAAFAIRANRDKEGGAAFARALGKQCPDFARIQGIANAAKHLKLEKLPFHAADTSVKVMPAAGGYGVGAIGYGVSGNYGGGPRVVVAGPNGTDMAFSHIARTVYDMWTMLQANHGW